MTRQNFFRLCQTRCDAVCLQHLPYTQPVGMQRLDNTGYIYIPKNEEEVTYRYCIYFFSTIGGSINFRFLCKPRVTIEISPYRMCHVAIVEWEHSQQGQSESRWAKKMSTEPLTRSEVFGQLRKELYGEEQSSHSSTHIFIVLGASVSRTFELVTTWHKVVKICRNVSCVSVVKESSKKDYTQSVKPSRFLLCKT